MFPCPKTKRKKKNIHVTDPGNGTRSDFRIPERNPPLEKVILTNDNVHIDISGRFGVEKIVQLELAAQKWHDRTIQEDVRLSEMIFNASPDNIFYGLIISRRFGALKNMPQKRSWMEFL